MNNTIPAPISLSFGSDFCKTVTGTASTPSFLSSPPASLQPGDRVRVISPGFALGLKGSILRPGPVEGEYRIALDGHVGAFYFLDSEIARA